MNREALAGTAASLVSPGKGILAADESSGTIKRRFDAIGVSSTEDARRDYRELLFRTETAMREHISGVILYEETIRQKAADGTPLVKIITDAGAIPGIKVDQGAVALPGFPGELVTEGLDGLAQRLAEYRSLGARFAKWRAVIDIGMNIPSDHCVSVNAQALARYAAHCQAADIVPIVEPEVLMDGDHDLAHCYSVSKRVLQRVFQELHEARVILESIVLKPNMVLPGLKHSRKASAEDVARATLRLLKNTVPPAVPGIAFLSGGQSELEATSNLNAMNAAGPVPWRLTFSYGRALQASALQTWSGKSENVQSAQREFAHRARMNGLASKGEWHEEQEQAAR